MIRSLVFLVAHFALLPELVAQRLPAARKVTHVDTIHGVAVADPYRWMEEMTSPEVVEWTRAQDSAARRWARAHPAREAYRAELARVAHVRRIGAPMAAGGRFFYLEADGAFARRSLIEERGDGSRRTVLHEDSLPDGAATAVAAAFPDPHGRLVAWSASRSGSSWHTLRIWDVEGNAHLAESLTGLHARGRAPAWHRDGFYYVRFPLPPGGRELSAQVSGGQVWYHRLRTSQSADRLVHDPGKPSRFPTVSVSGDGRWLVVTERENGNPKNRVLVRDLRLPSVRLAPLFDVPDATYTFIGSGGDELFFQTNLAAPRSRVVAVAPARSRRLREVVPERPDPIEPTIGATLVGGRIIAAYRHDAWLEVKAFETSGRFAYDLELPRAGSIWTGFVGRDTDREATFVQSDFADPGTAYRLDLATGTVTLFRRPDLRYDPAQFVTRQVFYHAKDGTRIPMFLAHHRDTEPGPSVPLLMYAYGAFGWAASPWFRPDVAVWMGQGGVFALPNIRGGGEYGDAWHAAGARRNKQTAIDDAAAAVDWLVAEGLASGERVAFNAGSASGMLAGALLVQRPDLVAAVTIDYPALDMVRLDHFTGGRQWIADFGSPDDPEDFRALLAYSPYHNIAPGVCYPATMVLPGERDEVTVPMHAYKFVARLQAAQACDHPVLLRVAWGAGHATGATVDESIDNWADQLAFLARVIPGLRPRD